jgi:hypothetical protein
VAIGLANRGLKKMSSYCSSWFQGQNLVGKTMRIFLDKNEIKKDKKLHWGKERLFQKRCER